MPRLRSLVPIVAAIALLSAGCGLAAAPVQGVKSPVPIINEDWADSTLLIARGHYYTYSTANGHGHVPVAVSGDFAHYQILGDALPNRPWWSTDGPWAPTVIQVGNHFVIWYTTTYDPNGTACITSAVSANPQGPFVDNSNVPLICGGPAASIDPALYTGLDGASYVTWKHTYDGVSPNSINSARLSPDAALDRLVDRNEIDGAGPRLGRRERGEPDHARHAGRLLALLLGQRVVHRPLRGRRATV